MLKMISSEKNDWRRPTYTKDIHQDVVRQSCQFSKSHCLSFERSLNRRTKSFKLVDSDVMGRTWTPSYSGFQYMLVIVDDFWRHALVYSMKGKSEDLYKFIEFGNTIHREFAVKIKCLRTDNGEEYISDDFFKLSEKMWYSPTNDMPKHSATKLDGWTEVSIYCRDEFIMVAWQESPLGLIHRSLW